MMFPVFFKTPEDPRQPFCWIEATKGLATNANLRCQRPEGRQFTSIGLHPTKIRMPWSLRMTFSTLTARPMKRPES